MKTLGCVPPLPGYLKAMKAVCDRHGALFILDEVMSGMGRTGTLHAWEQEDVVPDLQTIAKGLGAGYSPIGALLVNQRVVDTLSKGTGAFVHSQTYQGHPIACAAAEKVQEIIQSDGLLANVREMGEYLGSLLKSRLSQHPNVGDIRGRGLFWAVSQTQLSLNLGVVFGSNSEDADGICRRQRIQKMFPTFETACLVASHDWTEACPQYLLDAR